jgi:ABC-type transport system involved in multi-copper enzyme maturation permease subunit
VTIGAGKIGARKISTTAILTIARSTFGSFLRNKVILLFGSLFVCIVLLMMSPLLAYKSMTSAANAQQMQGFILNEVAAVISLVSGFGSLLAAWAAADSVAAEMKSGTILAVMARPLRRWEFLAGKYLGVLMLMAVYVVAMLGVTFLLAWLGGQSFRTSLWTLIVYPLVRYAIWAAISMLLVTLLHPIVVMGIVVILATLIEVFSSTARHIPVWLRTPVHLVLPLTNLLSEERFMVITRASLKPFPWTNHLTALAYGVDYALVCFLLAVFVFQRRSLARD